MVGVPVPPLTLVSMVQELVGVGVGKVSVMMVRELEMVIVWVLEYVVVSSLHGL